MDKCPKCQSFNISGPRYECDSYGREGLRYTCRRCGYSTTKATADAPTQHPRAQAAAKQYRDASK
jgi:predicted Zn-ribbon and HTH transcriptional regulator